MMRKTISILALLMVMRGGAAQAQEVSSQRLPIRKDHPRILFNKDQLPAIRAKCEGPLAKDYAQMKSQADERVDEILAEGFVEESLAERDGTSAGKAWEGLEAIGLLWHLTGDKRYAQAGRRLHELLMKMSEETIAAVAALDRSQTLRGKQMLDQTGPLHLAYDLFYDSLSEEVRQRSLHRNVEIMECKRKMDWAWQGWQQGRLFHGPSRAAPYVMAFYGDAQQEQDAEFINELAEEVYELLHASYLPGFAAKAAHRGGWNECFQCMCMTLPHQMPFWWRWRNATTAEEHAMYTTNPLFTGMGNWIVYNVMDWKRQEPEEYAVPVGSKIGRLGLHGTYWTVPLSRDPVGAWFIKRVPRQKWTPPPIWEKILVEAPDIAQVKPEELPETAIFEGWGWVSMRSDWSDDAVFAHVTCGLTGQAEPADLDDTSFIIYHKGLLAIDGIKPDATEKNTDPYSRMTLGHNTITVLDPDETLKGNHAFQYTWRPNPFPVNDGGQTWKGLGERSRAITSAGLDFPQVRGPSIMARLGEITAYQTSPLYDYVCMDGTKCYSENKLKSFTRQFVYLKPNVFVVFDRVVSTRPEFRKRWHLHFYNEPRIEGSLVHAEHEGGRLYCQTLLPAQATSKKVQGTKLEQADGTYVIPESWTDRPTDTWRLDVGPDTSQPDDVFLHVLQAVDAGQPRTFASRKFERDGKVGVEVTVGDRQFEVLLARDGEAFGHIRVKEKEKVLADRGFPQGIQDTYVLWKDDPRFSMWMTDSRFRYVIAKEDRETFGEK
jgi:heparin/heparan-sulfate lyase